MPKGNDVQKIAAEIDAFNQVIYQLCAQENVRFIDITHALKKSFRLPRIGLRKTDFTPVELNILNGSLEILPFFLNTKND